jgi:hypothetical protein
MPRTNTDTRRPPALTTAELSELAKVQGELKRATAMLADILPEFKRLKAENAELKSTSVAVPADPYAGKSTSELWTMALAGDIGAVERLKAESAIVEPEEPANPFADLSTLELIDAMANPATSDDDRQAMAEEYRSRNSENGTAEIDAPAIRAWAETQPQWKGRVSYTGPLPKQLKSDYANAHRQQPAAATRRLDGRTPMDVVKAMSPDDWLAITMMGVQHKPYHKRDALPMPLLPDGREALTGQGTRNSDNGFAYKMAIATAALPKYRAEYSDLASKAGEGTADGPTVRMFDRAEQIVTDLLAAGWLGDSARESLDSFAKVHGSGRNSEARTRGRSGPSRDSLRR